MSRTLLPVAGLALITLATLQTGCGMTNQIRMNPSPGLVTRTETVDQELNNFAIMVNKDFRSASSDLQRIMLLDRPSRMNPMPNPW